MPRIAESTVDEEEEDGLAPERVMAIMEGLRAHQERRIEAGLD